MKTIQELGAANRQRFEAEDEARFEALVKRIHGTASDACALLEALNEPDVPDTQTLGRVLDAIEALGWSRQTYDATLAQEYTILDRNVYIDGDIVPWHLAEPGPRIEPEADGHLTILWLPVIVNQACPGLGAPAGEPVGVSGCADGEI